MNIFHDTKSSKDDSLVLGYRGSSDFGTFAYICADHPSSDEKSVLRVIDMADMKRVELHDKNSQQTLS